MKKLLILVVLFVAACSPAPGSSGNPTSNWKYVVGPGGENCLIYKDQGVTCDRVNVP